MTFLGLHITVCIFDLSEVLTDRFAFVYDYVFRLMTLMMFKKF